MARAPLSELAILRQLLDEIDVAAYAFDRGGHCLYVNRGTTQAVLPREAMIGRRRDEYMPLPIAEQHVANDRQVLHSGETLLTEERNEEGGVDEYYQSRKFPLRDGRGRVVGVGGISRNVSALRRAESAVKQLATQHLDTLERERQALSHELHDEIGQMLTALKLALDQARRRLPEGAQASARAIGDAAGIADQILAGARRIARQLRPPQLDDLGLVAALRWHLDALAGSAEPALSFEENLGACRTGPALELICFRVAQEAVANALRHAGARRISVDLRGDDGYLQLTVRDDGRGFDTSLLGKTPSLGLLGMRERVVGAGGRFALASRPGGGTRVRAEFALTEWR